MEDSKKKQIKFEPEDSETLAAKPPKDLSRRGLSSEEKNTRQTTLEEFYYIARGAVKDQNVN